jgi:hypothetical protein
MTELKPKNKYTDVIMNKEELEVINLATNGNLNSNVMYNVYDMCPMIGVTEKASMSNFTIEELEKLHKAYLSYEASHNSALKKIKNAFKYVKLLEYTKSELLINKSRVYSVLKDKKAMISSITKEHAILKKYNAIDKPDSVKAKIIAAVRMLEENKHTVYKFKEAQAFLNKQLTKEST